MLSPRLLGIQLGPTPNDLQDEALARNLKMYLYQKYTNKKLKEIGLQFGIGDSGVSQDCRRVAQKIEEDKRLKQKIDRLEKQIYMSRMKT